MKEKSNKKIVRNVKKFVIGAVIEVRMLKKKSTKMIKNVGKKWESTKPEREKFGGKIKQAIKQVEKKANKVIKNTTELKNDITKGFKQGIRAVKKK